MRDFESALEDAKKCVSLDPDWSKGYIQKGSCYVGMQKYQEALAEYNKGNDSFSSSSLALERADDKSSVEKLIKDVQEKMTRNNLTFILFGDATKTLVSLENILRILIFVCVIISILPFPASLRTRFSHVFYASYFCILLIRIYRIHGRPRFNMNVMI